MNAIAPIHQAMFAGLSGLHYRRVTGGAELEEIGKLRSEAFDAKEIYTHKFGSAVVERFDYAKDSYVFGLYDDVKLVATVRLNVASAKHEDTPSSLVFPGSLRPMMDQGLRFIDPSRLSVDPKMVEVFPALPIYILRTSFIATLTLGVDRCLAVVREHHERFYRKVLKATRIAGPVDPGNTYANLVLINMEKTNAEAIQARYPIFNFTEDEQNALFADVPAGQTMSAPIKPSAAQAIGLDMSGLEVVDPSKVA